MPYKIPDPNIKYHPEIDMKQSNSGGIPNTASFLICPFVRQLKVCVCVCGGVQFTACSAYHLVTSILNIKHSTKYGDKMDSRS
jgi:hypothetical protein